MDLAASIQAVTEEVDAAAGARTLARETGQKNLCLAGGVALNCVANGKILREGRSSASGSSRRPATPAARSARRSPWHHLLGKPRRRATAQARRHERRLSRAGLRRRRDRALPARAAARCSRSSTTTRLIAGAADALADGKAVGWFQGRMEFGPRALGARSILGDARSPTMQTMNLKIKYRESFRPFAPSVLREDVADWFELDDDSPYMLLVADVVAEPAPAMTRTRGAVRHRQAERRRARDPGGHPRRLLGAHPDRARRDQPALPRLLSRLQASAPAARSWSTPASTCAASRWTFMRRRRSGGGGKRRCRARRR